MAASIVRVAGYCQEQRGANSRLLVHTKKCSVTRNYCSLLRRPCLLGGGLFVSSALGGTGGGFRPAGVARWRVSGMPSADRSACHLNTAQRGVGSAACSRGAALLDTRGRTERLKE